MNEDECRTCGRGGGGHWIGCEGTAKPKLMTASHVKPMGRDTVDLTLDPAQCTFDGCSAPRRSADKRVKFCETHSDPKNRK